MSLVIDEQELVVIAEGRIGRIDLDGMDAERVFLLDERPESPVVLRFVDELSDEGGIRRYIQIYDHRQTSRLIFKGMGEAEFRRRFAEKVPCLCGFRRKRGLYIVLNDVGTADMLDGGENQEFILTRADCYKKTQYRVLRSADNRSDACHNATGIRLCRPVVDSSELCPGRFP